MKKLITIILVLALMLFTISCGNSTLSWQEQYDLGCRYLSEGNYEEAIIAFEAAIKIEPKKSDAYKSLADVYIAMGDTEQALQILNDAVQVTGDESLQTIIDGLSVKPVLDTSFGTLDLNDLTYGIEIGPNAVIESNEGSIGSLWISAMVLGPKDVKDARIIGWFEYEPTQDEITKMANGLVSRLKEYGAKLFEKEIPFLSDNSRPIYEEDLGKTQYVLLGGLNSEMDIVAYRVVPVIIE